MADESLSRVATQLGRPVETLVELDRRPLHLLTQPGSYVTLTLRDRVTREVFESTLDIQAGRIVDAKELRQRDRDAVESRDALAPRLGRLLLRHADLAEVPVEVTLRNGTHEQVVTDPAGVLDLADRPDVIRVDLAEEIEVKD